MIADEETVILRVSKRRVLHYAAGKWGVAHTRKNQIGSGGTARKGNWGRRFYCGVNGKEQVRQVSQFRIG